ncbi:hypothetical protein D9M73_250900 [compost metagenome]
MISTNTAASAATPPSCSATSMAMGEVTDFGSNVTSTIRSVPNHQPSSATDSVAKSPPNTSVSRVGQNSWRIRRRLRNSGTASATVAGPRNTVSSWVLWRYSW